MKPVGMDAGITPRAGMDLLVRIHNLLKIGKFFELNNDSFQERLNLLWEILDLGLCEQGNVTIQVTVVDNDFH